MWPQYTVPTIFLPKWGRISCPLSIENRLWKWIDFSFDCWGWKGTKHRHGYGLIHDGIRQRTAHRVSWALYRGPIPAGIRVLHKCDNPPCCNPDHLFLGTARDNTLDMMAKGRMVVGDHSGEHNGRAVLNAAAVLEIREALSLGATRLSLAQTWGVNKMTIANVEQGKTWKHLL